MGNESSSRTSGGDTEPEILFMHACCYPIFDPCFDKFLEKSKNSEKH
jgi:hypothetical protein